MTRTGRSAALVIVGLLAITACTRPDDASDAIPPSSLTDDTSTDTSTTDATSTTTNASTTTPTTAATEGTTVPGSTGPTTTAATDDSAPATTSPGPPRAISDLTLIFDGILPFRFGDHDIDVIAPLTDLLGDPTRDELREYPVADEGSFLDVTGEESFVAPLGRTVCYPIGLCLQFGAGAPETLLFTGWRVDDTAPPDLTTEDGIAIGSTWEEHADRITFDPLNSCFQVGYAEVGGIDVTLLSDDVPFAAPSSDGDGFELGDPDPALVTVIGMSAGRLPVFIFADC